MDDTQTAVPESASQLFAAFQRGDLASRYAEVPGWLAALPDAERLRAGHLLARLDPDDVLRAHPTTPVLTLAITGHGTLAPLLAPLTMQLARHGLLLRPVVSAFDGYVFDLADPTSRLYAEKPDLTLCVLDPMVVLDELPVEWQPADVARAFDEKVQLLEHLVTEFEARGRGVLVLNTLPLPRLWQAQLVDLGARATLGALWREANARLLRLAAGHPSLVVVDLDPFLADGVALIEQRLSTYARAHLSPALLAVYAAEVGHLARHLAGRTRKCLVLDLDGTLWGGILGEDGVEGIEVADAPRGEAFARFQRVVRQLGSQGVLLAIVSKNDRDLVREALRRRTDMPLREDDFVRVTASWRPKHEALADLAEALNLGLDSLVFVDDSRFECELVSRELPAVAVVALDDEPASHPTRLLSDGWFATRGLTAEDRTRVTKYREEADRNDFLQSFDSLQGYLRELRVSVRLADAVESDVPRVSQLSLRTNQFNLTTLRMQPGDVHQLLADPHSRVLTIRSRDRFGDNGLVGAVFMRRSGPDVHIDNFVLSCRVFSRGIEQACLSTILDQARASGARAVHGTYRPSARNGFVHDLYPRYGFERVPTAGDHADGDIACFRHSLAEPLETPEHLHVDADPGEGTA
ncbi:D-glyceryl-ACP synthase [Frankia canadensis]|uniref:D-glyceryl-ACP synthase n=1 Tax=Frankia canadensis TaxID=1836972 RepID=A0A2I2KRQ6_9ACTN|nr:HAD-IIIC family phosphatase [Frankia canadensis]SNQ48329.1 D-glyceryl-ACP synthase [Frankia canadensis]SOU55619.1 D-glyceryl-ACP synthase [Frankia canadensis]